MVGEMRAGFDVSFLPEESKKENGHFGWHWPKWTQATEKF